MSNLNDLSLPLIDVEGEIWEAFFSQTELAAVKTLVDDLQKPMLGMGGIYPLDLGERLAYALQIVADAEDVSLSFVNCYSLLFMLFILGDLSLFFR